MRIRLFFVWIHITYEILYAFPLNRLSLTQFNRKSHVTEFPFDLVAVFLLCFLFAWQTEKCHNNENNIHIAYRYEIPRHNHTSFMYERVHICASISACPLIHSMHTNHIFFFFLSLQLSFIHLFIISCLQILLENYFLSSALMFVHIGRYLGVCVHRKKRKETRHSRRSDVPTNKRKTTVQKNTTSNNNDK